MIGYDDWKTTNSLEEYLAKMEEDADSGRFDEDRQEKAAYEAYCCGEY